MSKNWIILIRDKMVEEGVSSKGSRMGGEMDWFDMVSLQKGPCVWLSHSVINHPKILLRLEVAHTVTIARRIKQS